MLTSLSLGHGFDRFTQVKMPSEMKGIGFVFEDSFEEDQTVIAYDFDKKTCSQTKIQRASTNTVDCYFRISFAQHGESPIICSPAQKFYLPERKKWIPALRLKVGDKLLSNCTELKPIVKIEFVNKPLIVYSIQIEGNHNYLVGKHGILTHNTALPWVGVQLAWAFGEGATAGGGAGSFFGPPAMTVTGGIGAVIAVAVTASSLGDDSDPRPMPELESYKEELKRLAENLETEELFAMLEEEATTTHHTTTSYVGERLEWTTHHDTTSYVHADKGTTFHTEDNLKGVKRKINDLPIRKGNFPFIPKNNKEGTIPRTRNGGFLDKKGDAWEWDPKKQEWDVQHPDGSHTNVDSEGNITH